MLLGSYRGVTWVQALDKIRFESLTDKSKLDAQPELFIHLVPDKANKTLSIIDSGIGMTKAGQCTPGADAIASCPGSILSVDQRSPGCAPRRMFACRVRLSPHSWQHVKASLLVLYVGLQT